MHLDDDIVTAICKEYRCLNADVTVRYPHATVDELIDVIEGNRWVRSLNWSRAAAPLVLPIAGVDARARTGRAYVVV